MFHAYLGFHRNDQVLPFKVEIEGCPHRGVAAVDFRRQHGLPEVPDNKIELPGMCFLDEEFVRQRTDQYMDSADWHLEYCYQYPWHCNALGAVYQSGSSHNLTGSRGECLVAQPAVIKAYRETPCPETAKALIEDILAYETRSKQQAEQEAQDYHAEKAEKQRLLQQARELLKDELADYQRQIEQLQKKTAYLQKELERYEEEAEATC